MLSRTTFPPPRPVSLSKGETVEELRSDVASLSGQLEDLKKTLATFFSRLNNPNALSITQASIKNSTIDDSTIGATTASTGKFSTLETTSNAGIGITPTQRLHTSVADNNIAALFAGASKGCRVYVTAAGALVEGVDQTGVASYQPLAVGGSTLDFTISGNSKVSINTSGDLIPTQLLDISGASAGQIKFPATQNPSTNANTLDDYEEGTWTPVDASGAGLSLSPVAGTYTKVGRLVTVHGAVVYPVTASGLPALIGGLPFTVNATYYGVGSCYTTGATALSAVAIIATATIAPFSAANAAQRTNAQMSATTLVFSLSYEV